MNRGRIFHRNYIIRCYINNSNTIIEQHFSRPSIFRLCIKLQESGIITPQQKHQIIEGNGFQIPNEVMMRILNMNPDNMNAISMIRNLIYIFQSCNLVEIY